MLQKILAGLLIALFFGVFSYFYGEDFIKHQEKYRQVERQKVYTQEGLKDFTLKKIRDLNDTEFYYTPYKGLLGKIVDKIHNAKTRVYVEVYMLTETRIKEALIKAHKRGVDVKVILEHSPYKAVSINKKHFSQLKNAGINIVWSNPKNYALNHSKIMIIDEELILSTGNFTYSTFAYNRDLFVISQDKKVMESVLKIFLQDFLGKSFEHYDHSLVLSPQYSREKLEKFLGGASRNIKIYAQYLKDEKLFLLLSEKAKSGVEIEVILSQSGYEEYMEMAKNIPESFKIFKMKQKSKMHSKAFLVDDSYLFIGSINFSRFSLDENREMGILFSNKDLISKFQKLFSKDK